MVNLIVNILKAVTEVPPLPIFVDWTKKLYSLGDR